MSNIGSFFIHGFNSDNAGWEQFLGSLPVVNHIGNAALMFFSQVLPELQAEERLRRYINEPAFETIAVCWNSQKLGNKFFLALDGIFFDTAAQRVHEKWTTATEDAPQVGMELAAFVNRTYKSGDKIVISAHSLGTSAAYHAVKNIRRDLNIFLFFMAGVAECFECEDLIDEHDNVKYFFNFYNEDDIALSKFLPAIDFPNSPIGTVAMTPTKEGVAFNFETGLDHSDYMNISIRAKYVEFTHLVASYR